MSIKINKKIIHLLIISISLVLTFACKKDKETSEITPTPNVPESGYLKVSIQHLFDTGNFVLNDFYILDNGNKIAISTYKYYLSNIKLTAEDGSSFSESESYHLVNADQPATCSFNIEKVPLKKYTSVSFIIGVD